MSAPGQPETPRPPRSIFLSYASEDRQAAQLIRDALPTYGLEVWYDESALEGGDAWDQKIRRQIRECDFFMPVISARTEARHEGYFRREWRLAVERTLDMADDHTFLLPVVIDETAQAGARVPDKFLAVQWTRLPGGQPTAALEALCRRLASGQTPPESTRKAPDSYAGTRVPAHAGRYPEFPREEPGQKARFWALAVAWPFQSAWVFFNRFPKWIRICVYVWLFVLVLSKGCTSSDDDRPQKLSPEQTRKLKQISDRYRGDKADVAKLGAQIAQEFSSAAAREAAPASSLLAIPFSAPAEDAVGRKVADSTFAQVYGRLAISHGNRVSLTGGPLPDQSAAVELGRAQHVKYVLFGSVEGPPDAQELAVKMLTVADGTVLWSKSYPAKGADPARIAAEVDAKVLSVDED